MFGVRNLTRPVTEGEFGETFIAFNLSVMSHAVVAVESGDAVFANSNSAASLEDQHLSSSNQLLEDVSSSNQLLEDEETGRGRTLGRVIGQPAASNSSTIPSPLGSVTSPASNGSSKHLPKGTEFLVLVANRLHFSQCYVFFYLFMFILNTFAIVWVRTVDQCYL